MWLVNTEKPLTFHHHGHNRLLKISDLLDKTIFISQQIDKTKLKQGSRVALDMTTLTIMRQLPREVDPLVFNMSIEDPGDVSYSSVGGLGEQIRELREVRNAVMILLLQSYCHSRKMLMYSLMYTTPSSQG